MINYDSASKTYDNTRGYSEILLARLLEQMSVTEAMTILDFGCGTGNYLNTIQKQFGSKCCGVEPSDGMRALACKKNGLLDIRKGDHRNIPFKDKTIDFAFMTDVIHHVPELELMFSELWRVLKLGGMLCIVTESHDQIRARFYNNYFPSLASNERKRYPKIESILREAENKGFIHEYTELLPATSPKSITEKFIRNVEEKNFSMFRLLDEHEYADGLSRLKADIGRQFEPAGAGESLIWFKKPVDTCIN